MLNGMKDTIVALKEVLKTLDSITNLILKTSILMLLEIWIETKSYD